MDEAAAKRLNEWMQRYLDAGSVTSEVVADPERKKRYAVRVRFLGLPDEIVRSRRDFENLFEAPKIVVKRSSN
jgi:hypothetical protein